MRSRIEPITHSLPPRSPSLAPRNSNTARPGGERLAPESGNCDGMMLVLVLMMMFLGGRIIVRRVTGEWRVRHHEHGMVLSVDGAIGENGASIVHRDGVVER